MRRNHQAFPNVKIDLQEIILTLWKEKFLIIMITLTFTVAGYIYDKYSPQTKFYQTTITLREAPENLFVSILFSSIKQPEIFNASNFNKEFKLEFNSSDNLRNFVEQNKKLDEFRSYLKTNRIDTVYYFKDKLKRDTDNQNQYTLTFSKPLPGKDFLYDYSIYTMKIVKSKFLEMLITGIKNRVEVLNQNLDIAIKIDLSEPIIKSLNSSNFVVNVPEELFYQGYKVLATKIFYLEKMLNQPNDKFLDYNFFLNRASNLNLIIIKSYIVNLMFIAGFFSSFIIIFIRSIISKK